MINTAEAVTKYHPDKICDQIADAILDEHLKQDPQSRVAIEVLGVHGQIFISGEVTSKAEVDFREVAKQFYNGLVGKSIRVVANVVKQSPDISRGVDTGGAGDQGIMIGYACRENEARMPGEFQIARELLKPFETDGKCQVTMNGGKVTDVVLSVQGESRDDLEDYLLAEFPSGGVRAYCNNTGKFEIGGFDADSGLTGRKIVVDAYGPRVSVGGGAFSGKDPSKVDRSAAYMARWLALRHLRMWEAKEVIVKLAYVIGKAEPVMNIIRVDGKFYNDVTDCRPEAIIERFDLRRPIYLDTAANGHFGRPDLPWEDTNE